MHNNYKTYILIWYCYLHADHLDSGTVVTNISGDLVHILACMPYGETLLDLSQGFETPYRFTGYEKDRESGLNYAVARYYDSWLSIFNSTDPMWWKYPSLTPYNYCANNPVRYVDLDGRAWRPTFEEDHDGNKTYNGYEWVPEKQSYDKNGHLLPGLYAQAIFFSDNGTFDASKDKNIGSSTATVYLADGTTTTFDAMTYPSDPDLFATVPEGIYQANVGTHKGYTALKVRDIGTASQTIELGTTNPAYSDGRTYATGIDIHKAGRKNYTGLLNNKKNGVSQGCLLIDINNWSSFIGHFDNNFQSNNVISVTVSRSIAAPANANRLPAFNFIMSGTRRSFFNPF